MELTMACYLPENLQIRPIELAEAVSAWPQEWQLAALREQFPSLDDDEISRLVRHGKERATHRAMVKAAFACWRRDLKQRRRAASAARQRRFLRLAPAPAPSAGE
jgi:hypothetical protein